MADDSKKPVAHMVAIVEKTVTVDGQPVKRTRYHEIAALWPTRNNDSVTGEIEVIPVAWLDPKFPRKIVIQFPRSGNGG